MTKNAMLMMLSAGLVLGCDPSNGDDGPAMGTGSERINVGHRGKRCRPTTMARTGSGDTEADDTGESVDESDGSDDRRATASTTERHRRHRRTPWTGLPYDPGAPSCEGLETQCAGQSCCTTVDLPGGTVQVGRGSMGTDACPDEAISYCFSDETPEHDVTVDPFSLDHYVVTVGRFRAFVDAWNDNWRPAEGDGAVADVEGSGWQPEWNDFMPSTFELDCNNLFASTWTDEPGLNEDKPIDCVSWYHAQAFCIWDGGRLATEAEWEFAAAGGDQDRLFPWGAALPDETRTVFDAPTVEPVGTKPDGAARWGHLDMGGNTWEWVYDCWDDDFYDTPQASLDNAVLVPGTEGETPCGDSYDAHVAKGGGRDSDSLWSNRVATRFGEPGGTPSVMYTFRCAR